MGAGRPTTLAKLSDEARALILAEIRRGATAKCAAALAGVHDSTWYRWMREGADGEQPYADFATAVAVAERAFQADQETAIASSKDWRARAWLLERRCREEYGKRATLAVEQPDRPVEELSDAELQAIIVRHREHRELLL